MACDRCCLLQHHVEAGRGYVALACLDPTGTVAADYYRAMAQIEGRAGDTVPPDSGHLLALVDAL